MLQVRSSKLAKHSKYAPADGNRYDGIYKVSTVIQRTPLSRFDLGWKNNPTDKPVRWGSPLLRYYSSVNYLKLEYSTKSRFFCKKLFENLPLLLLHDLFNTFLPFFCFQSPSYAFLYWSSLISINITEYHNQGEYFILQVVKYWPEKGKSGFIVWRYLLRRDDEVLCTGRMKVL